MKKLFVISICALFTFVSCSNGDGVQSKTIRVMDYNVRNCKGIDDDINYNRIANVINRHSPDVVAIQELDSITTRYNTYVLGVLANLTDMHDYFAPARDYKGGKYGLGILSKKPALSMNYYPLPGSEEARVILIVEFEKFYFACTHLSLTEVDQIASASKIRELFATLDKPVILAGDFNARPQSESIKAFDEFCTLLSDASQCTFPADQPSSCIDYIFANDRTIKSSDFMVINEPQASDHRPLFVELEL